MAQNVLSRSLNITGADLTGSDGGSSRTYTISGSNLYSPGMSITVSGTTLHQGASNDYTVTGQIITFNNAIFDSQQIFIQYFVLADAGLPSQSNVLKYASVDQFVTSLGLKKEIPSWDVASTPTRETVGTGDGSATTFYLDQRNIIPDSYTLYYGSAITATTTLIETTHFTIDTDKGKITLTAAGVTLLSTDNIYAEYSYIGADIPTSHVINTLLRAEDEVDNLLNTTFRDGTQDNPDYPCEIELRASQGVYNNSYFTYKRPVIDIATELDGDITSSDTTLDITAGDGVKLPSTGIIVIGKEKIRYTGISTDTLTGLTRGYDGSTAAAHSDGDEVHTTIVEISGTAEGTSPTWYVQEWKSDVFVDESEGRVTLYRRNTIDDTTGENILLPYQDVANRVRLTYLYGFDTIPYDIVRLTIILGKRMLMQDTMSKALISGRDEFNPEMFNADSAEINRIVNGRIQLDMMNS